MNKPSEVRQDEEFGFRRKYKKVCQVCGTHYRSKSPINHKCCGKELKEEADDEK